ncbi:MAG: helix-turn-helix domain-containing protein [Bacteroidota bacterium]
MNFRYFFSLLFSVCFFGIVFPQKKDSLQEVSFTDLKQSFYKFQYSQPETAKVYADALLEKAIREGNKEEAYESYLLLSVTESYFGNLSKALENVDKSITFIEETKDAERYIRSISRKGSIYYEFGKYDEATKYYISADSLARIHKNIRYQIFSNQNIGNIKTILGKHEQAVELYLKNEALLEPLKKDNSFVFDYTNTVIGLCSAYSYFDLKKAEEYLVKIKEISLFSEDKDALAYYYTLKGIISYLKKEYLQALETFETADSLVTTLGRKRNLFPIYRFQGKANYAIGNFAESIKAFEKIKVLRDTLGFDHFKYEEVIGMLALSYDTLGKNKKALENFILGIELRKITDSISKSLDYEITDKYDNKIWEEKIAILQKQNDSKNKQNTSLIYLSIGLGLVLILSFIIYQRIKINNKKKFKNLLLKLEQVEKIQVEKSTIKTTKEKKVPDEKVTEILKGLQKFEHTAAFLHKNTSLTSVAKKLNTNTSYLSKTINAHKGMTFINYITKLRIDYALQNLKNNKVLRSYSIKAIAEELGFKSEGAFSRAFKKQTGIYPSYFIKNLTADS